MSINPEYSLGLYEKAMPKGMSFEEMLENTRVGGFDRLEISIDESDARLARLNWTVKEQQSILFAQKNQGVDIKTMCLSGHRKYPFGSHDAGIREKSKDIMKKAVDFSCEIGVRIIQLAGYDVYYEKHDSETEKLFCENLAKAVEYAAESGVVLAFETMETPFMDTVAKAMKYVSQINSPWLGVYPDIGNLQNAAVVYNHDVTEDIRKGLGHIFAVHIKETKPGVYRDMSFGSGGHTRYDEVLSLTAENNIRMYTGEFWYQEGSDWKAEISQSSEFLRNKLDNAFTKC